jgi:hypothetical protein
VQEQRFIRSSLEFAALQESGGGSLDGLIGSQQKGLGLGLGAFGGLLVDGQNGQHFGLDSGKRRKRQLSPHGSHYFTRKAQVGTG